MNYFHVDQDGSIDLKLGPLYFSSCSQIQYDEKLDHGDLSFSQGFCDIHLDLPGIGLFHAGFGTGPGGTNVFRRLDNSFLSF